MESLTVCDCIHIRFNLKFIKSKNCLHVLEREPILFWFYFYQQKLFFFYDHIRVSVWSQQTIFVAKAAYAIFFCIFFKIYFFVVFVFPCFAKWMKSRLKIGSSQDSHFGPLPDTHAVKTHSLKFRKSSPFDLSQQSDVL